MCVCVCVCVYKGSRIVKALLMKKGIGKIIAVSDTKAYFKGK